jgi:outer membrane murein-binding lipoprotein Lpp
MTSEERIQKLEGDVENLKVQIVKMDAIINEIHNIATNLAVLTAKTAQTADDVKELKIDVNNIKSEPAKNWKDIVSSAISAIVGGIIAIAISMIFK